VGKVCTRMVGRLLVRRGRDGEWEKGGWMGDNECKYDFMMILDDLCIGIVM
jgi:hypothetical protein